MDKHRKQWLLLVSVFVAAICGLVYELVAGALSSYLLGDSIMHFSLVIGFFLSSMGVGSFLSKYIQDQLVRRFIQFQLMTGILGGFSAPLLFLAFTFSQTYTAILLMLVVFLGTLIGFEIPLLVRIFRQDSSLRISLSNVLAFDYLGALVASILFPLILVPYLGLIRASIFFGIVNVSIATALTFFFQVDQKLPPFLKRVCFSALLCLVITFGFSGQFTHALEDNLYEDDIIYAKTTKYQRIIVTRWRQDIRLFLNGALQFSTLDEYRYHESLVHPAMALAVNPRRVLILGGGDGMAAREVLKYATVETIDLVDLDRHITTIFQNTPLLVSLNQGSLQDARVRIINADAMKYLEESDKIFDVIIIDLPDPNTPEIGKLYSRSFYKLVFKRLSMTGHLVTQATSPFYAKEAFWCIARTIEKSGRVGRNSISIKPYNVNVPSFGEWGFVLATQAGRIQPEAIQIRVETKFLTSEIVPTLFTIPKDLKATVRWTNELDSQKLVQYYNDGWGRWNY